MNNKIFTDLFEEISYHPSLDIKNNVLILGFRVSREEDKEGEIFVIVSEGLMKIASSPSFTVGDKTYQINLKRRRLAKMSQKWGIDKLNAFYESFVTGSSDVNPLATYTSLKELLKSHMDIEDADAILICTWAIGTYFFPIFSAYSYLHIKAPKGSGKTQCLSFLNQVCFNAVKARASLPALRDTVDSLKGTYLMDQADALYRPNNEDLLDILTDSYKPGGGEIRKMVADKGKNWNIEEFQAYSPKAFASINNLPEDLRDRCLIISLVRSNKVYKPLDEESSAWKEHRGDCYKLVMTKFPEVVAQYNLKKIAYQQNINPEFVGRQLELWLPFEVMFAVLGIPKDEGERAKQRFLSQYNFSQYQASELERAVIETVLDLLKTEDSIVLSPKDISEKIDSLHFDDTGSTKQQAAQVGKIISKFNLSSEKLKRDSKGERYLFKKAQVDKVHQGYFALESEAEHTPTYIDQKDHEIIDSF